MISVPTASRKRPWSICGEQVDDGEGLLGEGDGPVDGREAVGGAGGPGACSCWAGRGRAGPARFAKSRGWAAEAVAGVFNLVQDSDADSSCDHDEDNQIGSCWCGEGLPYDHEPGEKKEPRDNIEGHESDDDWQKESFSRVVAFSWSCAVHFNWVR